MYKWVLRTYYYMKNLLHIKKYRKLEQAEKKIRIIQAQEKKKPALMANQKI